MVKALFDTNILIDYLNGIDKAKAALNRFEDKGISIITWMEVMIGTTAENNIDTKFFLSGFEIIAIDESVAEQAVKLRKSKRIKLPDAIVWGSAIVHHRILVTRDAKGFAQDEIGIQIPYSL